jgi:hypothetical protein
MHQSRIPVGIASIPDTNQALKEALMKKLFVATFISVVLLLLFSFGCSSTPAGTISVEELQKNAASRLGQDVVVVGDTEIKTDLSSFRMFKLTKDYNYIWVSIPEGTDEPPQATKVRVTGKVQQKEFSIVGKIYFIEATKIRME